MRTILVGLAGAVIAACGGEGASEGKTYGPKPSDPAETGGAGAAGQSSGEDVVETTGGGSTGGEMTGGVSDGSTPSQNQSRPMQAAQ